MAPIQGDQFMDQVLCSEIGAAIDSPGYLAPGHATPEHLIPQPFAIHHDPRASRDVCTPLPGCAYLGVTGVHGAGCLYPRAVAGGLVAPPQVAPTAEVHQPAHPIRKPIESSYSSLCGAICEECAGIACATDFAPTPSTAVPEQASSPDDDVFDLEALEKSLAASVVSSTSSSLSDPLVGYYASLQYTGLAPVDPLPTQHARANSMMPGDGTNAPEAIIWYANPGAPRTTPAEPMLDIGQGAPIVDTNLNRGARIPSMALLASPIIGYHPTFHGCVDKCQASWPPSSTSSYCFGVSDAMTTRGWGDGTYFARSSSSPRQQAEVTYPFVGAGN